jgi:hypothetical protein
VIRGLPEHTLLDRIVRGRAWIPLLGVLLVGIVAMQVEILKLGTGMGRWIERSSSLSTKNQALQASVAGLMDDQRIERLAAKMGMVMPDPTAVSFLSAQPGAARAVANIHAPDPSIFTAANQTAVATSLAGTASAQGGPGSLAGGSVDTSSSTGTGTSTSTSGTGADAGTGTSSATATAPSPTTTGAASATTGGAAQPVDSGATSSGGGAGQPSGSGGAASIAPPASQSSGSTGG